MPYRTEEDTVAALGLASSCRLRDRYVSGTISLKALSAVSSVAAVMLEGAWYCVAVCALQRSRADRVCLETLRQDLKGATGSNAADTLASLVACIVCIFMLDNSGFRDARATTGLLSLRPDHGLPHVL